MNDPHHHVAGLLRQGHWLLETAAYEISGDRYSPTQCRDTANAMEELAAALREHAETLPGGEHTGEDDGGSGPDAG
ncbi:hypothetical protein CDG81_17160 [Actinopolyspora erythraea]|uniref:Uncharacterized protein n=1 Tax=Actinopolyspora erythraea TaxID=414996 RepID=A0A099D1A0_9ACTN|nr:hypothetical protein [Actinopolyspora erythraea]ASU79708.1 hypothetical protein CDG81_17160 [Actinopolyspora erythraea]KGI79572.1 hypothetical protein IL38_22940 [Actinopolyspora erythraea]